MSPKNIKDPGPNSYLQRLIVSRPRLFFMRLARACHCRRRRAGLAEQVCQRLCAYLLVHVRACACVCGGKGTLVNAA